MSKQKKMLIIGCGGAGVVTASEFEATRGVPEELTTLFDVCYVDTSRANIPVTVEVDRAFTIPGLDGAGGNRALYADPIRQAMPNIVSFVKPADIHVIIYSASGGSGSTIGPMLASQLLKRGMNVVCVVIGDTTTIEATKNTIGTLRSIDGVARANQVTMPIIYAFNSVNKTIAEVNREIRSNIVLLATLFSGNHEYIDSRDLYSWLHFHETTEYDPGLAMLEIMTCDRSDLSELKSKLPIASMITLGQSLDERAILGDDAPEYQKVGLLYVGDGSKYSNNVSIFYALHTHGIARIVGEYTDRLVRLRERANASREQIAIADPNTVADDGMFY